VVRQTQGLDADPGEAVIDQRRRALLEASKLKLAAKARLAEGGDDAPFEASVLYHAAARSEQRALRALEAPSPEARLAAAIERCACLIDGLDASAVMGGAWASVLDDSAALAEPKARAMRSRIDAMVASFFAKYQRVLAKDSRGEAPLTAREMDRLLEAFPGDAHSLAMRSLAHIEASEIDAAWRAIQRARRLAPENTRFAQISVYLVPMVLPRDQAEAQLADVRRSIRGGRASDDVYFGLVSATRQLAPAGRRNAAA
jgi:hypothetical protein